MLRIGQEAVNNVVRHARANRIQMGLHYDDAEVTLHVSDDGCGFDDERQVEGAPAHYGLISMRERAEEMGGRLEVKTQINHGTEVRAIMPVGR